MITDVHGIPLVPKQRVVLKADLVEARVLEVNELVAPGRLRSVVLQAIFTFSIPDQDGPAAKLPVVVTAAQDEPVKAPPNETKH